MLIASISVGDTLVTLTRVIPVTSDPAEQLADTFYHLTLTDMPTDERYTHVIKGENDALHALAAWIAADEADGFPTVARMREHLRRVLHGHKHLRLP
jgi:hypothetical protein